VSFDSTGDDVNEIIESNIPAVSRKSFEFSCAEYSFMVVPTESYSSQPAEFLAMIQQMVSSAFSFTGNLEFIPKPSLSLAEFEVCHTRHPLSIILPSLRVMTKVPTALHLHAAYIDDITRQIAICYDTY